MTSGGRIKFAGNPWPKGHAIATAEWTAVLAPDGLRFHFHVQSADYDAEDDGPDVREPTSDLARLQGKTFRVDRVAGDELPRDVELEDLAFGIYLLGHDAVVDHRIRFVARRGPRTYDLRWRARIALAYIGHYTLEHRLDATLPKLRLARIGLDDELDAKSARALLPEVLVNARRFELKRRAFVWR